MSKQAHQIGVGKRSPVGAQRHQGRLSFGDFVRLLFLEPAELPRSDRLFLLPESSLLSARRLFALCVKVSIGFVQLKVGSVIEPGSTVAQHLRSDVNSVENDPR